MNTSNSMQLIIKICFLILCCYASPSLAKDSDTVWLKNGDRFSGVIQEITNKHMLILIFGKEHVSIPKEKIMRWNVSQKPKKIVKKIPYPIKHYALQGNIDLNVNIKNTDKKDDIINVKTDMNFTETSERFELTAKYMYEQRDHVTKKHKYNISPAWDHFQNDVVFIRSAVGMEYDLLEDNYLSVDYGAGIGYRPWHTKRNHLELIGLAGLRQAHYKSSQTHSLLGTNNLKYPTATFLWKYNYSLPNYSDLILFSDGTIIKYLHNTSNLHLKYDSNISFGLRHQLSNFISLSISSEVELQRGTLNTPLDNFHISVSDWQHLIKLGVNF